MNLQRLLRIAMVMLCLLTVADVFAEGDNAIHWLSYRDLQKQTDSGDKKFFLYFKSSSCGYCRLLEKKTFTNEQVIAYLNNHYRPVWINTDNERDLARQFAITGVPDLRFLSPEGKPIARWPGYIEAKDLLNLLKYVSTDSYLKMGYADFIKQQG